MEQLGFYWKDLKKKKLVFEHFSKICRTNSSFVEIWQKRVYCTQKTYAHLWLYIADSFLEWEMFRTKFVDKIKTHISCPPSFFSPKIVSFMRFSFHWRYSPLWAMACRTIRVSLHFSLSVSNSFHLLTPSIWKSFSTSPLHPFLSLSLRLIPFSFWVKIILDILFYILSRWPR